MQVDSLLKKERKCDKADVDENNDDRFNEVQPI